MSIIDKLDPAYYRVRSLNIVRHEGEIIVIGDLTIHNKDGIIIAKDSPRVTLSANEKTTLAGFVSNKLDAYEQATGLQALPSGI
jgi:hypothetical protein